MRRFRLLLAQLALSIAGTMLPPVVDAEGPSPAALDGPLFTGDSFAEEFGKFEIFLLVEGNRLLRYSAAGPARWLATPITGVRGRLLGIDRRPADGRVYGIDDRGELYTLDLPEGRSVGVSSLTLGFEGSTSSGFDFNPQADRLRLIAASGQNLRVHVTLGAVAVDGPLEFALGDRHAGSQPQITAAAYTDNLPKAAVTRLFEIDWKLDVLVFQDPPNDGALQSIGPLGVDFDEYGAFDILTGSDGGELAIAASGNALYRIDLDTGAALRIGSIDFPDAQVIGIALVPAPAARP